MNLRSDTAPPAPQETSDAAGETRALLLYDGGCGLCRWTVAGLLRRTRSERVAPVPIESPLGAELLADLDPEARMRAAHLVIDGGRFSGGEAAAPLLKALGILPRAAALAGRFPRATEFGYRLVAGNRRILGRMVPREWRTAADAWIAANRLTRPRVAGRSPGPRSPAARGVRPGARCSNPPV